MASDKSELEKQAIIGTVEMIEKIENNKLESVVLAENLILSRAESHVIKIIGDEPGIFSSEIARRFNVTRAAIQKTLGRLEKRVLLSKEVDTADKKRIRLYLTDDGKNALNLLTQHQMKINAGFFSAIALMTAEELDAVNKYLAMACSVLDSMQNTD